VAQSSKSHDALWLTNAQTEMFSAYAQSARSSCLLVGAVASCCTHAGLQHWNFGHWNCCASVEQSMSWRRLKL